MRTYSRLLLFAIIIAIFASSIEAARLPEVGDDSDDWGDILNEFLSVSLDSDGTLLENQNGNLTVNGTFKVTDTDGNIAFMVNYSNESAYSESAYIATLVLGLNNTVSAAGAIAMGYHNTASNIFAIALGKNTEASGENSMAVNFNTVASGEQSFASGYETNATGSMSVSMGMNTVASGMASLATGSNSEASGNYSFAVGQITAADGLASTAMGRNTVASGDYSFASGWATTASGLVSTAMGDGSTSSGDRSTAIGHGATASGMGSIALGDAPEASGAYSVAIGQGIEVNGAYSVAIALSDQSGTNVTENNVMAIMGGNVGIGTPTPGEALDVNGSINATGDICITGGNCLSNITSGNVTYNYQGGWTNNSENTTTNLNVLVNSGDISLISNTLQSVYLRAIRTEADGDGPPMLIKAGDGLSDMVADWGGGNLILEGGDSSSGNVMGGHVFITPGEGSLTGVTSNVYIAVDADTETAFGKVLVGGTAFSTPEALLDVGGATGAYIDGENDLAVKDDVSIDDKLWVIGNTSLLGYVGIKTSTPARTLHINDTMRIEPTSTAPSSPSLGDLYVDSDSNELCFYNSTAWIGIATGGTCS